ARDRPRAGAQPLAPAARRAVGGTGAKARRGRRRRAPAIASGRARDAPRRAEPLASDAGRTAAARDEQGDDRLLRHRGAARRRARDRDSLPRHMSAGQDRPGVPFADPAAATTPANDELLMREAPGAAGLAGVAGVVCAAPDERAGAVRSAAELLDAPWANHHPRWRLHTPARADAERLLREFFATQRSDGRD